MGKLQARVESTQIMVAGSLVVGETYTLYLNGEQNEPPFVAQNDNIVIGEKPITNGFYQLISDTGCASETIQ